MTRQRLHIHQLSRLAFAQVADWNRILNELKSARKQMFWSYKPLRSGAFNLLQAEDSEQAQEIYRCVAELAKKAGEHSVPVQTSQRFRCSRIDFFGQSTARRIILWNSRRPESILAARN